MDRECSDRCSHAEEQQHAATQLGLGSDRSTGEQHVTPCPELPLALPGDNGRTSAASPPASSPPLCTAQTGCECWCAGFPPWMQSNRSVEMLLFFRLPLRRIAGEAQDFSGVLPSSPALTSCWKSLKNQISSWYSGTGGDLMRWLTLPLLHCHRGRTVVWKHQGRCSPDGTTQSLGAWPCQRALLPPDCSGHLREQ